MSAGRTTIVFKTLFIYMSYYIKDVIVLSREQLGQMPFGEVFDKAPRRAIMLRICRAIKQLQIPMHLDRHEGNT